MLAKGLGFPLDFVVARAIHRHSETTLLASLLAEITQALQAADEERLITAPAAAAAAAAAAAGCCWLLLPPPVTAAWPLIMNMRLSGSFAQ